MTADRAKLEIACFNLQSALVAEQAEADRIELCADADAGGITPNLETVIQARLQVSVPIYVMIRMRGGNFVYSDLEFEQMKNAVIQLKNAGINGFVFGILNQDITINITQNKELVDLAKPFPCTFHRAFDEVSDYKQALEDVISCGFSTILTSGTKANAIKGKEILAELVALSQNRIVIMPGGGVRSTNIAELHTQTSTSFYHSSAVIDKSGIADFEEIIKLKNALGNF